MIDQSIYGLHEMIDNWHSLAAEKVYKYFGDIEATFHTKYLYEDKKESQTKLDAKLNLRKAIKAAKEALPSLALEIEKCGERRRAEERLRGKSRTSVSCDELSTLRDQCFQHWQARSRSAEHEGGLQRMSYRTVR